MEIKNLKKIYTEFYVKSKKSILYPSEYLVRIFKSEINKSKFNFPNFKNQKLLDLSCGDGRNLQLFYNLKFKVFATEISNEIIKKVKKTTKIKIKYKVGTNASLPFDDDFFDFIVSSNSCYYIDQGKSLKKNLMEIKRVMKKNSFLIGSIPSIGNYYFKNAKKIKKNHYLIKEDYLNLRNNYILAGFENKKNLISLLSSYFKIINIGTLNNNYFGIKEKMYIFILKK
jgi:SAM-dependent methyltransferase